MHFHILTVFSLQSYVSESGSDEERTVRMHSKSNLKQCMYLEKGSNTVELKIPEKPYIMKVSRTKYIFRAVQ